MEYPVNKKLEWAIHRLFDDPGVPYGLLAQGVSKENRDIECSTTMTTRERIKLLRDKLESFIVQMATELDELGEDELPRLRSEATAILLALREIHNYFSDMIDQSIPSSVQ